MSTPRPAPPLPPPQPPAAAARALARAAQAAATAWAHPLDPAAHGRAVSQLHSVLRDLGIAARGLAGCRAAGTVPGPADGGFALHMAASSGCLLDACQHLDGVLAAEGLSPSRDPDEPGAALCKAARDAILAWRQPAIPAPGRDDTVAQLITATGFITAAALDLAATAPRRTAIGLHAAAASITQAITCLTAAARPRDSTPPAPPDGRQ